MLLAPTWAQAEHPWTIPVPHHPMLELGSICSIPGSCLGKLHGELGRASVLEFLCGLLRERLYSGQLLFCSPL